MAQRLVVLSLALVLGAASTVSADYSTLDVTFVEGSLRLSCTETYACETMDECDGYDCVDINDGLSVCLQPSRQVRYETFCCQTVADCPARDGQQARGCAHIAGDVSVCLWPGTVASVYSFCAGNSGSPSLDAIAACFGPSGLNLVSLATGDCDQDGIPNATDSAPCTPLFVPFDGGFVPFDGDVHPFDFGVNEDGSDGQDGGTSSTGGVSFQGGGGCVVSPSSEDAQRGALALVSLLVLGILLRGRSGGRER